MGAFQGHHLHGITRSELHEDEEAQVGAFLKCLHTGSSLVTMEGLQGQHENVAKVTKLEVTELELMPRFP